MIIDQVPDVEFARWNMPDIVRKQVYLQWRENSPRALVAESQEELKHLVSQGFTVVMASPAVYRAVTADAQYKRDAPRMKETGEPAEMLRQWFARHSHCLDATATADWAQIIMAAREWRHK